MAITVTSTYDGEVIGDWSIQVRRKDVYSEDGVELSQTFNRHVIHPDCDWENHTCNGMGTLPTKIKNLCAALFTDEVKAEYAAEQDRLNEYDYKDNPRPTSPEMTTLPGLPR